MSHLGRKPVRGGRPPNDRKIIGIVAAARGDLAHIMVRVLMLVVLFSMSVKKAAAVIIIYRRKLRRARGVESCETITIHPRWAIDEYARSFRN